MTSKISASAYIKTPKCICAFSETNILCVSELETSESLYCNLGEIERRAMILPDLSRTMSLSDLSTFLDLSGYILYKVLVFVKISCLPEWFLRLVARLASSTVYCGEMVELCFSGA